MDRNPLPVNYRHPNVDDYEHPLDLVDDALIYISRAISYHIDNLTLYSSTRFMMASHLLSRAADRMPRKWGSTLSYSVGVLRQLADDAEDNPLTYLAPAIMDAVTPIRLVIIGEPYLGISLKSHRRVDRIRRLLEI
jgi:hypothetical protein